MVEWIFEMKFWSEFCYFWWERIWQSDLFDGKRKANILLLFNLKEIKIRELFWQINMFWMVWRGKGNLDQKLQLSITKCSSVWTFKIGINYLVNSNMEFFFWYNTRQQKIIKIQIRRKLIFLSRPSPPSHVDIHKITEFIRSRRRPTGDEQKAATTFHDSLGSDLASDYPEWKGRESHITCCLHVM